MNRITHANSIEFAKLEITFIISLQGVLMYKQL